MPVFSVWLLESQNIAVSGGVSLSGFTQGDASQLLGQTITLLSNDWVETLIDDNDSFFDDNDAGQDLDAQVTINGVTYPPGTVVEAEYTIVFQDPDGNTYTAYGFNLRNSDPSYATIEGLVFLGPDGAFPPQNVPLTVIAVDEGPGDFGNDSVLYEDLVAPICFVAGTRLATPDGQSRVETLEPGDLVLTGDSGAQPVRWIGQRRVTAKEIAGDGRVRLAPVRIRRGALGEGQPRRDLLVSPQHRLLVTGWRAELHFGEAEVLVAACHLVDGQEITVERPDRGVSYFHIMFDRHEIVLAEGLPAESFCAGPEAMQSIPEAAREELLALFPELAAKPDGFEPARPIVSAAEAALVRA
ncbi:MAG: Hint domain-containing protein [Paracoccaceae bacterium]|nr:Hint domain-containing protein [Paracoccaceae bacterium]